MGESVCRCGKRILWAVARDGKRIPLDPSPPVYFLETGMSPIAFRNAEVRVMTMTPDGDGFRENQGRMVVSHFATCKFANDFSGGGGK